MRWRSDPGTPELTSTLEEKIKHALIPGRVYIRYRAAKEWYRGEPEVKLLSSLIDKKRDAIDAGANKGTYTYFMAKAARHVYAFEPNPKMFAILQKTVGRNVSIFPIALSNSSGTGSLRVPYGRKGPSNQGSSLSTTKVTGNFIPVTVETRRIDDLGLSNVGFIKIDVEGFEEAVLAGAAQTIMRDRPNLLIEIEERHTGIPIKRSLDSVCSLGYDAFVLSGGGLQPVNRLEPAADQLSQRGYVFNYIFLPAAERSR
jgi:FkbM family methyltransferase